MIWAEILSFWVALVASSLVAVAQGQDRRCACAPSSYRFRLTFGAPCVSATVADSETGIYSLSCQTFGSSEPPVVVESISFKESAYDKELYLNEFLLEGPFRDGDVVNYIPKLATDLELPYVGDNSRYGLHVSLHAYDTMGDETNQTVWLLFSQECDIVSIIQKNDRLVGWLRVAEDPGLPVDEYCHSNSATEQPITSYPTLGTTMPPIPTTLPTTYSRCKDDPDWIRDVLGRERRCTHVGAKNTQERCNNWIGQDGRIAREGRYLV